MNGKRSKMETLGVILGLAPAGIATMRRWTGLDTSSLQRYLEALDRKGMLTPISVKSGGEKYQVTDRGRRVMDSILTIERQLARI